MLQRAASNAYSWWWASHIRTKQSKWLEQNLQDMEEKVQIVLKLIEEDGDSFARRAEMYYKKRPELIHFVEESYRAYRALAERYDHISTELQNANTTIASVFPDQVQFEMEEEEEEDNKLSMHRFPKKPPPKISNANIPKAPKNPIKDLKSAIASATKKMQPEKPKKTATIRAVHKSGLSKREALKEIDKLQKQILTLQTVKEFAKSSYESGLAKYWETENQIVELQERICSFQDEFGAGMVIEDEEARTLMAAAALKSCQEMLAQLQEKQARSIEEAQVEYGKVKNVHKKFESLKIEFLQSQVAKERPSAENKAKQDVEGVRSVNDQQQTDEQEKVLELLREKIKEHFEACSDASLTVTELAEKTDEVVNKVISLETGISSQAALVQQLQTETNGLQLHIRALEDDKATLVNGRNDMSSELKEVEEKLHKLLALNQNVEDQKNNLQTHFTEAECSLNHLSEKLHSVKPDEELVILVPPRRVDDASEVISKEQGSTVNPGEDFKKQADMKPYEVLENSHPSEKEEETPTEVKLPKQSTKEESMDDVKIVKEENVEEHDIGNAERTLEENANQSRERSDPENISEALDDLEPSEVVDKQVLPQEKDNVPTVEEQEGLIKQEDEPNWKDLYMNGMDNREKGLLTEYITVLRNYKDVKKKLSKVEKKPGDTLFDMMLQLKEMKSVNAKKDEQIKLLHQKLTFLQVGLGDDSSSNDLSEKPTVAENLTTQPMERDLTEDIDVNLVEQTETSEIEDRFRINIDELLEKNLDFWLRFSISYNEIQKFNTEVKDLQGEISKLQEKRKKQEGSSASKCSLMSDVRPLYKHLRQIQTELTLWLEKSVLLKDELHSRSSSLCEIQEEITKALKASAQDDDFKFTSYQAAKFQGEVLNMKQENNKVADELQAGLDHVANLQLEVERTMANLSMEFGLSGSKNHQNIQLEHSDSKSRVPLRSFIFGVRAKKQKHSIFSIMHPGLHRKYNGFRSGLH